MTDENRVPEELERLFENADDLVVPAEEPSDDAESSDALDAALGTEDELVAQRDEYLDALRRLQAEFDNYRKRVVRQQTDLLERASQSVVERLLPVLDAFDLAIAHVQAAGTSTTDEAAATLVRIESLLRDVLDKEGLERIDTAGVEFDPTIHDAVASVAAEPQEDDTDSDSSVEAKGHAHVVDDVMRAGYRLKGRVLRPAMVRVRG